MQNPLDPRIWCSKYLLKEVADGKITINALKYNLLCNIMQEKPIDIKLQINYPSKQCIIQRTTSIPPLILSPLLFNYIPPITPPPLAASLSPSPPSTPIPNHSPPIHNCDVNSTSTYVKIKKEKLDKLE